MTELVVDPHWRAFTIGRVLQAAWQGFARRYVSVTAICLAAGLAGTMAARLVKTDDVTSSFFEWQWLLGEIVQVAASTLVVTPGILLLLAAHSGRRSSIGELGPKAAQRCVVVAVGEVILDVIIVVPTYFLFKNASLGPLLVLIVLATAQETILLAFNSVYLPALAAGPSGPFHAMGNALGLARRNWLRLLVIGFMISLMAGIIVFGTNLVAQLAVRWVIRAAGSVDYLLLFDIAQGLGYGIRLMVFISIAGAGYHLLQRAKYGGLPGEMARVFD